MKYIRTKDGRILKGSNYGFGVGMPYKNYDVKVANTIEELCDEFVGIDSQGHYIIHNDKYMEGARIMPLEEVKYYGAIWCDFGLKYVAKMNEKGELELL